MALNGKSLVDDAIAFLRNPKGEIGLLRTMKAINQKKDENLALQEFNARKERIPFDDMPKIIHAAIFMRMDTLAARVIKTAAHWTIEDKGDEMMQAAVRGNCTMAVQALVQRNVQVITPPATATPPASSVEQKENVESIAAQKAAELHTIAEEATRLNGDLKINRSPIQFKKNHNTPV